MKSIRVTYIGTDKQLKEEIYQTARYCAIHFNISISTVNTLCEGNHSRKLFSLPKGIKFEYIEREQKTSNSKEKYHCELCYREIQLINKKQHELSITHRQRVLAQELESKTGKPVDSSTL